MVHDYEECVDPDCSLCGAFVEGAMLAQATMARGLLHIRDYGSFPPDVQAARPCAETCGHDYCHLIQTLVFVNNAMREHGDSVRAAAWAAKNPLLANQLRDALGADDGGDG